jgi:hypothetical protein
MSDPRETPVTWRVERPRRMSVTLGRKADACPRDAGLYLRFRGGASTGPLLRGSLVHLFHERMMEQLMQQGEASLVAAQEGEDPVRAAAEVSQTTKEWIDALVDETGWPLSEAEIDEARVMAYHIAIGNSVDPSTVVALESMMVLEIAPGVEMIGKVDVASIATDGVLQVDDLKSSFYIPPEDDVQKLVQSPWYAAMLLWGRPYERRECAGCNGTAKVNERPCWACDGLGYIETIGEPLGLDRYVQWVRCRQVYPRFLNPTTGLMSSRGDDKIWGLADLRDKVTAAARAWARVERGVNERVWPAKSGDHCSECTAPVECPLPSQLRRFAGTIHTVEEAREAKEWAVRQGDLTRATNAEVTAFVKAQGLETLEVGSDLYGLVVSSGTALKKAGRNTDWEGLRHAIVSATEFGEPFAVEDWLRATTKTEFKKIKREEQ